MTLNRKDSVPKVTVVFGSEFVSRKPKQRIYLLSEVVIQKHFGLDGILLGVVNVQRLVPCSHYTSGVTIPNSVVLSPRLNKVLKLLNIVGQVLTSTEELAQRSLRSSNVP
eukprot:5726555-Amphidinium_carterae.1